MASFSDSASDSESLPVASSSIAEHYKGIDAIHLTLSHQRWTSDEILRTIDVIVHFWKNKSWMLSPVDCTDTAIAKQLHLDDGDKLAALRRYEEMTIPQLRHEMEMVGLEANENMTRKLMVERLRKMDADTLAMQLA